MLGSAFKNSQSALVLCMHAGSLVYPFRTHLLYLFSNKSIPEHISHFYTYDLPFPLSQGSYSLSSSSFRSSSASTKSRPLVNQNGSALTAKIPAVTK